MQSDRRDIRLLHGVAVQAEFGVREVAGADCCSRRCRAWIYSVGVRPTGQRSLKSGGDGGNDSGALHATNLCRPTETTR